MTPHDPVTTMATSERVDVEAPYRADAPNVVVIVMDDLGFAQLGCYGSDIDTPNLDRLAERGVRFTGFHTTAICSPTRACLLTGRNHHRVGMGMLPDLPTTFPGYTGELPDTAATLAEVLRGEGYATFAIGKWHLTPRDQRATGPYDTWPQGKGFDRYYGFLNGETNQWTPNLVRGNIHVEPPATPDEGYHLDADLADEAIAQLRELRVADPTRPFFLWYATAAPHAPHQAPPEWLDRHRGRFDQGWDAWREARLARQQELGLVPGDVQLSERPPWIDAWDELDDDRKQLYARMMEVFAGFVSHADHQIGRVLDHLEQSGELERTVVVLVSDNGCSAEGGPHGSYNQMGHYISAEGDDLADELAHLDDLGGFRSSGHYPWGWAHAGNTPFRRWKRYTFEGGVRDPMVVAAPMAPEAAGSIRHQYCHAVDVFPTVLDLLGVEVPDEVGGIEQLSVDGTSLVPVLHDAAAPDPRTSQYYECWGSRAMYHDGWKAVTDHVNQLTAAERESLDGSHDFATDRWSLYDLRSDPTETVDLAASEPDRLSDLVGRWHAEAERNGVLPLDDGTIGRFAHMRVRWTPPRSTFRYRSGDKVHEVTGPNLAAGFRVVASLREPLRSGGNAPAVLCEQGDWLSGWALYVAGGDLCWCIATSQGTHVVRGPIPADATHLTASGVPGEHQVAVSLHADEQEVANQVVPVDLPLAWSPDGAFLTVGWARPFPVCEEYAPPASSRDVLDQLVVDVGPPAPFDLEAEVARLLRHQ
jgi:arylsulfatase